MKIKKSIWQKIQNGLKDLDFRSIFIFCKLLIIIFLSFSFAKITWLNYKSLDVLPLMWLHVFFVSTSTNRIELPESWDRDNMRYLWSDHILLNIETRKKKMSVCVNSVYRTCWAHSYDFQHFPQVKTLKS